MDKSILLVVFSKFFVDEKPRLIYLDFVLD